MQQELAHDVLVLVPNLNTIHQVVLQLQHKLLTGGGGAALGGGGAALGAEVDILLEGELRDYNKNNKNTIILYQNHTYWRWR